MNYKRTNSLSVSVQPTLKNILHQRPPWKPSVMKAKEQRQKFGEFVIFFSQLIIHHFVFLPSSHRHIIDSKIWQLVPTLTQNFSQQTHSIILLSLLSEQQGYTALAFCSQNLQMARKHIFVTKKIEPNCQLIDIENLPKSFKTSSLTHPKVAKSDILIDVVKN